MGDKLLKFLQQEEQPGQLSHVDRLHRALPTIMKGLGFRELIFFRMCENLLKGVVIEESQDW